MHTAARVNAPGFGGKQLMALPAFSQADCTASQSAVVVPLHGGDADLTEIVMPFAGSIRAISVQCEAARTAGTCTVDATINGTVTGLQAVLNATNTQYAYGTQAAEADAFTAGQRVGVKVTTDGSWAADTTPSIGVVVWVEAGAVDA